MNSLVLTFKEGEPPSDGWYLVKPDDGDVRWDVDNWSTEFRTWSNWPDVKYWAELPVD